MSAPRTPWERGRLDAGKGRPKLLFGRMYEDSAIETSVFPSSGSVFTIASAGCTSMALAERGLKVTAVDINPAQVAYVRARLGGAPAREGTADRLFSLGRRLLPLMGLGTKNLHAFLQLEDGAEQIAFWRGHLDTRRFRAALRLVINRVALRAVYDPTFLAMLPRHFDRVIRARIERCIANHPNRTNPYAWRLFLGTDPPGEAPLRPSADRIDVVQADAATFLEHCPPKSFIGFTLSNILDGTEPAYGERLMAAVRRSAQAGALMVLRSFAEPSGGEPSEWIARDRSMLWGVVRVQEVH